MVDRVTNGSRYMKDYILEELSNLKKEQNVMLKYKMLKIGQLIETLEKLHSALNVYAENGKNDYRNKILTECQESMIKIDEIIENSEDQNISFVHDMEEYCENVYLLSQNYQCKNVWYRHLDNLLQSFQNVLCGIITLKVKIEIVFFPYKASMWDSLESIWMAAQKDPECVAYVVPIPYYERNGSGQFVAEKYEINQFPPYVPVIDYREYSVSKRQPDIAYIHNPYDQFNNVTSVPPDYYSSELKKYVEKLVYVPYFLSFNAVSFAQRELPSYYRVDNIVVQSEKMIESFAPSIPKEKFVTMGSPIVDRILYLDKNKPEIPEQWKSMLPNGKDFGGKTVVMYNTSLAIMMKERDNFLDKIENVIDEFSKNDDIFVILRPHPLMHSTLQKMGDKYILRFLNIQKKFLERKIGVLDKTADVGIAVALCDAYVGEAVSSIVNMFGIAGKARFFIAMKLYQNPDLCNVNSFGKYRKGDEEYFVAEEHRILCRKNLSTGNVETLGKLPGTKLYPYEAYRDIYVENDNIYIQPYSGDGLCIYNMKKKMFRKIYMKNSISYGFKKMKYASGALYLIPNKYNKVVRFDIRTEQFSYFEKNDQVVKDILVEVSKNKSKEIYNYRLPMMNVVRMVRAKEIKECTWGTGTMCENDESNLQDYLFYITVDGMQVKANLQGGYKNAINNFDGTCGQEVHKFLKSRLLEIYEKG